MIGALRHLRLWSLAGCGLFVCHGCAPPAPQEPEAPTPAKTSVSFAPPSASPRPPTGEAGDAGASSVERPAGELGVSTVESAEVPAGAVTPHDPGAQPHPSQKECRTAIAEYEEYVRLLRAARVCRKDDDCQAHLRVTPCSNCRAAVNHSNRHLARLRELETAYEERDPCSIHACNESYNCGRVMWAKCEGGLCQTWAAESQPECGSPSPLRLQW